MTTRLPQGIAVTAAAGLEKALEQVFRLDPALEQRLPPLSNKVIHFDIQGPNIELYFLPHDKGISVLSQYDGKVNCQVSGKPSDFVELLVAEDAASTLINGGITVSGESATLMTLQALFKDMQLDWEYELSRVVGDVAAHEIGKAVKHGMSFFQHITNDARNRVEAAVKDETSLLPSRAEIEAFCDDVDSLAARVDRLAAKLKRTKV